MLKPDRFKHPGRLTVVELADLLERATKLDLFLVNIRESMKRGQVVAATDALITLLEKHNALPR